MSNVKHFSWMGKVHPPDEFASSTSTTGNAYVAEDGITFYVAEDGVTFYVQE